MDTSGRCSVGMGISRLAKDSQEQAHAKNQRLDKPEDSDVCAGRWFRACPPVVVAGRTTFGQNARYACTLSRPAVRNFLVRSTSGGGGSLFQGRDTRPLAWSGQAAVSCELERTCGFACADAAWLVDDLAARFLYFFNAEILTPFGQCIPRQGVERIQRGGA